MKSSIRIELIIAVAVIAVPLVLQWAELHSLRKNLWSKPEQMLWAEQMRSQNPGLKVPEVLDVAKAMQPAGQN